MFRYSYDSNKNSTKQAHNFINIVKLEVGDLPPIVDIEAFIRFGNNNLRKGIKNWLKLIEEHYGVISALICGFHPGLTNFASDTVGKNFTVNVGGVILTTTQKELYIFC